VNVYGTSRISLKIHLARLWFDGGEQVQRNVTTVGFPETFDDSGCYVLSPLRALILPLIATPFSYAEI
jgi:hypothetical protein